MVQWCVEFIVVCGSIVCRVHWSVWFNGGNSFSSPRDIVQLCLQVGSDDVCGCPLVRELFEETDDFCRVLKRKCNRHISWEKLRRAEIDMERLRQVTRSSLSQ